MPDEERTAYEAKLCEAAYTQARADMVADLRAVVGMFVSEVRALRAEVRAALGLPPLPEPESDDAGDEEQPRRQ